MRTYILIVLLLLVIACLEAQQYATIDANNIYVYKRTLSFSGGRQTYHDDLMFSQPRFTNINENTVNITISKIVGWAKNAKLLTEIVTQSKLFNTNLIGAGVPGYMTVSFSYVEGQGWGWYLTCPPNFAPLFYQYWQMTNEDTLYYFQPAQPTITPHRSPYNY